jgi:hypothetical protein
MPYSKFTLDTIEQNLGIQNQVRRLFESPTKITPSNWLLDALQTAQELPVRSEKAKSESIIFPILLELRNRNDKYFTIYSGDNLTADVEKGLDGECDFILARETGTFNINLPISIIGGKKK